MSAADVMACLRAHPPPRLHTLQLFNCVPLQLSDEQWAALQPPSALLPQLENLWRFIIWTVTTAATSVMISHDQSILRCSCR